MARVRASVLSLAVIAALTFAASVGASAQPDPAVRATDSTFVWRLEKEPSECIGFNPKPNCGYKPADAGERGGALQISLFFVMIGAIGVIGTVIARNVIKRDRVMNDIALRDGAQGSVNGAPPGGAHDGTPR